MRVKRRGLYQGEARREELGQGRQEKARVAFVAERINLASNAAHFVFHWPFTVWPRACCCSPGWLRYLLPAHWALPLLRLLLKLFHTTNEMEMNRSIDRQRRLLCTTFQAIDRSTFVCAYFLAIFNLLLLPVDIVVVAIVADCCWWSWTDRADRSDLIVVIVLYSKR